MCNAYAASVAQALRSLEDDSVAQSPQLERNEGENATVAVNLANRTQRHQWDRGRPDRAPRNYPQITQITQITIRFRRREIVIILWLKSFLVLIESV